MKPTRPAAPKLGELLETRGKLDREGLFRAMRQQRAAGGRLGTALIELELVSEDDLLHVLSDQLKLPFASPEDFRAISEEATKLIPVKIARARMAVPLRASGSKLDVAMVDPKDLAALDELAFVSGRRIRPHVSTELRIHEGLARCYGVDIPSRFVKLLDHQNRARFLWAPHTEEPAPEETIAAPVEPAPLPVAPPPLPIPPPQPIAPPPQPLPPPQAVAPPATPAAALAAEPSQAPSAGSGSIGFEEAERLLNEPADRDAVATVLLDFIAPRFERAVLLMVRRDEATGWVGTGAGESADPASIRISLEEPSVLQALRDGASSHRGGLAPLPAHGGLDRWLSASNAIDLLALPLRVRERLVGAIFVANQGVPFDPGAVDELQRMATKASMALELLVLRQKLRRV
jgi:hypothetical protein